MIFFPLAIIPIVFFLLRLASAAPILNLERLGELATLMTNSSLVTAGQSYIRRNWVSEKKLREVQPRDPLLQTPNPLHNGSVS